MDNDNKELRLDPLDTEVNVEDVDFDPTESEEFYSNLEAAIGGEEMPEADKAVEVLQTEDNLVTVAEEAVPQNNSPDFEDELFAGVDAALAEQIEQEFGRDSEISSAKEPEQKEKRSLWKRIPTWTKVLAGIILFILIAVGLLFGTKGGKKIITKVVVSIAMDLAKKDPYENEDLENPDNTLTGTPEATPTEGATPEPTKEPDQNPEQNPDATPEPTVEPSGDPTPAPTEEPVATPEPTATPKPSIKIMDDEDVINVLLLGIENVHGNKYGRADAILVASVDLNGGPLKLISFQRDLYVSIKGHSDDKLNAAYAYGGASLMMDTMEKNFGIDIDSYVIIDFEGFEDIIDQMGGLRLSLTANESEYLNTKGYISKPAERNTVAGYQTMTGSQVLGYCRIRMVSTAEGLKNDRGRNYRHRAVLQALFEKYKEKSFSELLSIMGDCFNYVTVPSNLEEYAADCLYAVVENKMYEIETLQVPQSGLYKETRISGADVIVAYPECVDKLQEFIYGED